MVDCLVLMRDVQNLLLFLRATALSLISLQNLDIADRHLAILIAAIAKHKGLLLGLLIIEERPYIDGIGVVLAIVALTLLVADEYGHPCPIINFLSQKRFTTRLSAMSGVKNSISLMGGLFRS
jgi:hypothetical protein